MSKKTFYLLAAALLAAFFSCNAPQPVTPDPEPEDPVVDPATLEALKLEVPVTDNWIWEVH